MREWSREDLDRWAQQIRDNELPWKSQAEMVQYTHDVADLYQVASAEVERLRSLWVLVSVPLGQLVGLRQQYESGVLDVERFVAGCLFWLKHIEEDLLT